MDETTTETITEGLPSEVPADPAPRRPAVPPALLEFMSAGWAPQAPLVSAAAAAAPYHEARRRALSVAFPDDWLVIPTGVLKVRANDTDFRFRPGTDFAWLVGSHEPDAVLVLAPHAGGGHLATLYTPPRADRSSPGFFTDRRYGELWIGPRPGLAETALALGVATAPLDDLATALKASDGATVRLVRGQDPSVDALVAPPEPDAADAADAGVAAAADADDVDAADADAELLAALAQLRLVKDDHELACLRQAVEATIRGFEDVVRALPESRRSSERWVEGTFNRRARTEGNDVGYDTIAAAGHHACTLHWTRNDGPVRDGDLLLLDAGVEGPELYTADVTRTLPISGRYTAHQREVYDAVWRAQLAGIAECRPGRPFMAPHRAAMRVITEWLVSIGILRCTVEDALDPDNAFHRRYTLHGTSHMLGLDVHDCAHARGGYHGGDLVAGMVLTVEPGCYFQPDDLTVPEPYRGIGVRIEDDVVVTADGCGVLSAALPTQADDVERWMGDLWERPPTR